MRQSGNHRVMFYVQGTINALIIVLNIIDPPDTAWSSIWLLAMFGFLLYGTAPTFPDPEHLPEPHKINDALKYNLLGFPVLFGLCLLAAGNVWVQYDGLDRVVTMALLAIGLILLVPTFKVLRRRRDHFVAQAQVQHGASDRVSGDT